MILGDNIFYGNGLGNKLQNARRKAEKGTASVFGYYVDDPEQFGVIDFDENDNVQSIEEKPAQPKSNYAATGLYFYPAGVSAMAKNVKPSDRGELEITTLNQMYLERGKLSCEILGRGFAWMDTGTIESLLYAGRFVHMIETSQGMKISAPEEIAYRFRWINKEQLLGSAAAYGKSLYGQHLKAVAEDKIRR